MHLSDFLFRRRCSLFAFCLDRLFFVHTEFLAERVRETVFDGVGVRSDRHTHVLQFANDLGVVAIQLAGKLVNSKLGRHVPYLIL